MYRLPFGAFLETRRCIHGVLFRSIETLGGLGIYRICVRACSVFEHACALLGEIGWPFLTKDERWR